MAQFGDSSRWASAARWKQASILFDVGQKVRPGPYSLKLADVREI